MAVAFATALGSVVPAWSSDFAKNIIVTLVIVLLAAMNVSGVTLSKLE